MPGQDASADRALLQQPAAHAAIRCSLVAAKASRTVLPRPSGSATRSRPEPWICSTSASSGSASTGDLASAQRRARLRQGVDFLPRVPGRRAARSAGGAVQRHAVAGRRLPRRVEHRFVVAGRAGRRAGLQRLDAIGLQPLHHPRALLVVGRRWTAPHLGAQRGERRRRPLAAAHQRVPGFVQCVGGPAGQLGQRTGCQRPCLAPARGRGRRRRRRHRGAQPAGAPVPGGVGVVAGAGPAASPWCRPPAFLQSPQSEDDRRHVADSARSPAASTRSWASSGGRCSRPQGQASAATTSRPDTPR